MASSPEAWNAFQAEVQARCLAAAGPIFSKPHIAVDPTASAKFGLAIVFGKSKPSGEWKSVICIYDKEKKTVELGSKLGTGVVRVRGPGRGGVKK